jgi:hypothetical protein
MVSGLQRELVRGDDSGRVVVIPPVVGLDLTSNQIGRDPRSLYDCLNVRIRDEEITNAAIGYLNFNGIVLDGEVTLIHNHVTRDRVSYLIFGTRKSFYLYDDLTKTVSFLNPRDGTGTASASGTAVTGFGTLWNTNGSGTTWDRKVAAGDYIHFGNASQENPASVWYEVQSVNSDTSITLTASAGTVGSGVYTIRKSFSGLAKECSWAGTFPNAQGTLAAGHTAGQDLLYVTNGSEMTVWNHLDATFSVLQDSTALENTFGFTARGLAVIDRFLLFWDIRSTAGVRSPGTIRGSAIGAPENMATLEAAQISVSTGKEIILNMVELGDNIAVYTDDSIDLITYVGQPTKWAVRRVVRDIHPMGRRAITTIGDFHEFIGHESGYRFDGANSIPYGTQVFRDVARKFDATRSHLAIVARDDDRGEMNWIIPLLSDANPASGSAEIGYLEHFMEKGTPFTARQLPATAVGRYTSVSSKRWSDFVEDFDELPSARFDEKTFGGSNDVILFGSMNGAIYELNAADSLDGATIECFAEFSTQVGSPQGTNSAFIKTIEPGFVIQAAAMYSVDVCVLGARRAGDALAEMARVAYAQNGSTKRKVAIRKVARFFRVCFSSSGANKPWYLRVFAIDTSPAGSGY